MPSREEIISNIENAILERVASASYVAERLWGSPSTRCRDELATRNNTMSYRHTVDGVPDPIYSLRVFYSMTDYNVKRLASDTNGSLGDPISRITGDYGSVYINDERELFGTGYIANTGDYLIVKSQGDLSDTGNGSNVLMQHTTQVKFIHSTGDGLSVVNDNQGLSLLSTGDDLTVKAGRINLVCSAGLRANINTEEYTINSKVLSAGDGSAVKTLMPAAISGDDSIIETGTIGCSTGLNSSVSAVSSSITTAENGRVSGKFGCLIAAVFITDSGLRPLRTEVKSAIAGLTSGFETDTDYWLSPSGILGRLTLPIEIDRTEPVKRSRTDMKTAHPVEHKPVELYVRDQRPGSDPFNTRSLAVSRKIPLDNITGVCLQHRSDSILPAVTRLFTSIGSVVSTRQVPDLLSLMDRSVLDGLIDYPNLPAKRSVHRGAASYSTPWLGMGRCVYSTAADERSVPNENTIHAVESVEFNSIRLGHVNYTKSCIGVSQMVESVVNTARACRSVINIASLIFDISNPGRENNRRISILGNRNILMNVPDSNVYVNREFETTSWVESRGLGSVVFGHFRYTYDVNLGYILTGYTSPMRAAEGSAFIVRVETVGGPFEGIYNNSMDSDEIEEGVSYIADAVGEFQTLAEPD